MKLWQVTIARIALVLAETEQDAAKLQYQIESWESPDVEVEPFSTVPWGWDDDCLVYQLGPGDVTLPQAIAIHKEAKA